MTGTGIWVYEKSLNPQLILDFPDAEAFQIPQFEVCDDNVYFSVEYYVSTIPEGKEFSHFMIYKYDMLN